MSQSPREWFQTPTHLKQSWNGHQWCSPLPSTSKEVSRPSSSCKALLLPSQADQHWSQKFSSFFHCQNTRYGRQDRHGPLQCLQDAPANVWSKNKFTWSSAHYLFNCDKLLLLQQDTHIIKWNCWPSWARWGHSIRKQWLSETCHRHNKVRQNPLFPGLPISGSLFPGLPSASWMWEKLGKAWERD